MRKLALVLPSVVLGLYACANAGGEDLGDDTKQIVSKDAGTDASTGRKDGGGTASPPKDAGGSSSGDAGKDAGHSSSSGGSSSSSGSSSSGGTGGAEACSQAEIIAAGIAGIEPTEAADCDSCPTGSCCADVEVTVLCYDL